MKFHTPATQNVKEETLPQFALLGSEMVCPKNVFLRSQYPDLPMDLVKVTGQNGQRHFIPRHKLKAVDA